MFSVHSTTIVPIVVTFVVSNEGMVRMPPREIQCAVEMWRKWRHDDFSSDLLGRGTVSGNVGTHCVLFVDVVSRKSSFVNNAKKRCSKAAVDKFFGSYELVRM